ncbi:MAG TPA: septal ring lytic transglycosylase RlpA family protein [Solirubrobacteraceae bacterium]|nr:septal ring lytic transglycosylase RlpA family protein [Solirubrobacteraceae bacterium]
MRPRPIARPALAGALCFAFTCAAAESALAQSDTVQTTPTPSATSAAKPRIGVRDRKTDVRAGTRAAVRGAVGAGGRSVKGLLVSLQVKRDGRWKPIDRDRTTRRGRYVLRERVTRTGTTPLRVRVAAVPGVVRSEARRVGKLRVYRWAYASWYGPGFYGQRTACGQTLGYGTLGVAHKSLPCGSKVTFKKGRREVTVRVIDRGPFVGGREYDLTGATARRLNFGGHGSVLATR